MSYSAHCCQYPDPGAPADVRVPRLTVRLYASGGSTGYGIGRSSVGAPGSGTARGAASAGGAGVGLGPASSTLPAQAETTTASRTTVERHIRYHSLSPT